MQEVITRKALEPAGARDQDHAGLWRPWSSRAAGDRWDIYELTLYPQGRQPFPGGRLGSLKCATIRAAIIGYLLIGTDNTAARKQVEAERMLLDWQARSNNSMTRSLIESNIDGRLIAHRLRAASSPT